MIKLKVKPKFQIEVEKVMAKELAPGDLFVILDDPDYFLPEKISARGGVGEGVFIRTENPYQDNQVNEVVYRVKIIKKDEQTKEVGKTE